MSIKKKQKTITELVYCRICESRGWGMYCTGKCKAPKRKKKS